MQAAMTPDERAELRKYLDDMDSTESPSNSDDQYADVCKLLDLLIDDNKLMHDEINMLREAVLNEFDGLYGGVQGLYDKEQKSKGVDDLRSKYGSRPEFAEFDKVKMHTEEKDTDLFDKLYDLRKEARGDSTDFDDDGFVESFATKMAEVIAGLKADGSIPKDAEVEVKIDQGGRTDELDPILRENIEKYKKTPMGRRV